MKTFKLILIGILGFIAFAGLLRLDTLRATGGKCDVVATCSCDTLMASGYYLDTCFKNLEVHRLQTQ